MRISETLAMLSAVAGIMVSCGEKKKEEIIITRKEVPAAPAAPVAMQEYSQEKEVDWNGMKVRCVIRRSADKALPKVYDEGGQEFYDNSIRLQVERADGSFLLDKTFTKSDFVELVSADYKSRGILEGIVFDRVEGSRLRFAASVCHPQTDEYIPLLVFVGKDGSVSYACDTQLDISSEE